MRLRLTAIAAAAFGRSSAMRFQFGGHKERDN